MAAKFFRTIWENTDSLTKWIQVMALVFAAVWTFLIFRATVFPGIDIPPEVSASISGRLNPGSDGCSISAVFGVSNNGMKDFSVARIDVSSWRMTLPPQSTGYYFMDVIFLEDNNAPLWKYSYDKPRQSPLITVFTPKTGMHQSLIWTIFGSRSSELSIFRVQVYDKKGIQLGDASAWGYDLCSFAQPNQQMGG